MVMLLRLLDVETQRSKLSGLKRQRASFPVPVAAFSAGADLTDFLRESIIFHVVQAEQPFNLRVFI
jgi:hypothetical protein